MSKELKYEIVMEGDPQNPTPVLYDKGVKIGSSSVLVFNKNDHNMHKHEYFTLRFDIRNFKTSVLRFVPDPDDMFWAKQGETCPDKRSRIDGVLWVSDYDKSGEWIEVTNSDMSELDFWFALNFAKKSLADPAPSDYVALDPGGSNQNGGIGGFNEYLLMGIVGAVAAGAASYLIGSGMMVSSPLVYVLGGALFGLAIAAIARSR